MRERKKINILLVDDKRDNLFALESILESPELELFTAMSGNQALALLLEHDFALVLLDVQMPEMDGFETAELMRGSEKTKHIPIIFLTAISKERKHIFKGYESGAVDYLFKPLDPEILQSKVKVFVEHYRQKKLLEKQAFELEQKMTELSTVLLELQGKEKLLKKQAEELEKVNKELRAFAYIVSHDLKAPLRAIGSLANWLAMDYGHKLEEEGREQIKLLIGRVKRMHELIDGILQYSRVGRIREQMSEVDLNELVQEVIDLIAPPKNVRIKVKNELPAIFCERVRMQQVFQNLLSNAIKFMDKPRGEIKIGCVEEDGYVEIHVADNGPGIEEKYFNKIFQIFQTLNPRDEIESTGVGLTLVKKIVEMYGGKIWVESKVGQGSTFFFTMPKNENHEYQKQPL
jgi:signal transduction histidine kinase